MKLFGFPSKKNSKGINEFIPTISALKNLKSDELKMIEGIVNLSNTVAHEIMKPRVDVVTLDIEEPITKLVETVIKCGHSRIPVYENSIDNIIGILYAKDLLKYFFDSNKQMVNIRKIIREASFIPEMKRISDLLREFKEKKIHIAVVVDEYGGFSGIVCLEDILEEIVGEIHDEYDHEELLYEQLDENTYRVAAKISIFDLNEKIDVDIPEDISDSLGGFVMEHLNDIPHEKDSILWNDYKFEIEKMIGYKIDKIKIYRLDFSNDK